MEATTEERIREIVREEIAKNRTNHRTPKVQEFNNEMDKWFKDQYPGKDFDGIKVRNNAENGLKAAIKTKLQLKNILSLSDEQVAEAREIFERYKHLLQ
ncbi:MAG: hypothetical protein ABF743_11065 [Schleiferilactobacillus perolens]|jgi:hypothetical protein|uniref:hypothetical protein n=1 Tax=Schleiferilactobacillus perolens TaxID=100468 RepID=UPI0039EBF86B